MNTNAKHTPGPWIAHGITINHEQPGVEYPIATTTNSPIPTEEAYANARLIAAAPAMLEALRAVAALANGQGRANLMEVAGQAQQIIAQAEGGAQ